MFGIRRLREAINFLRGLSKSIVFKKDAVFNTDVKTTFDRVKDLITLRSEKIDY